MLKETKKYEMKCLSDNFSYVCCRKLNFQYKWTIMKILAFVRGTHRFLVLLRFCLEFFANMKISNDIDFHLQIT